jgi:hypothetical protein
MSFDYNTPAELFLAKRSKNGRKNYQRFTTAAEAIRCAVEDLRTPKALGAWLQVGDERFGKRPPIPDFKVEPERATALYDFGARCVSA